MPRTHERRYAKQLRKNLAQIGRCLSQVGSIGALSDKFLLLELCSTIRCTKNNPILSNITVSPSEEHLRIYSNVSNMDYTMMCTLEILPMGIYVNYKYMANILSLKKVADSFRMNMDTK